MKVLCVIPARYNSTRFPGKPIADICGKPMIWWVYDKVKKSNMFAEVVIATDDDRIMNVCHRYEMNAVMTSEKHDTPTSRLHEISTRFDYDLYVMIMGDEPLIDERCLPLIVPSKDIPEYYVAALTNRIDNPADVIDYTNQKVVTNKKREALFISRSPIPYPKGTLDIVYEKVTGVQAFSKAVLDFYEETPKSEIEKAEENDLMRFIENGIPVKMTISEYKTVSVDSEKDLEIVRKKLGGVE